MNCCYQYYWWPITEAPLYTPVDTPVRFFQQSGCSRALTQVLLDWYVGIFGVCSLAPALLNTPLELSPHTGNVTPVRTGWRRRTWGPDTGSSDWSVACVQSRQSVGPWTLAWPPGRTWRPPGCVAGSRRGGRGSHWPGYSGPVPPLTRPRKTL